MKFPINSRPRKAWPTLVLAVLLSFFLIQSIQAGPWVTNGPLNAGRFAHTPPLLLNGQVLIVGGAITSGAPAGSAKLSDPATGTNRLTGAPKTPRRDHTATLLLTGKVLVA